MWLFFLLSACEAPVEPHRIAYTHPDSEAHNVKTALDELYKRCGPAAATAAAPAVEAEAPSLDADLRTRLQVLEIKVAELEASGLGKANLTTYDPARTTLDARNVQDAMDGLFQRVVKLEDAGRSMGSPGQGLFELRDKAGNPLPPEAPTAQANPQKGGQPGGGQPGGGQAPPNGGAAGGGSQPPNTAKPNPAR